MKHLPKLVTTAIILLALLLSASPVVALTTAQIDAILRLTRSFGVSESVVQSIYASLTGQTTPTVSSPSVVVTFPVPVTSPNGGETLTQKQPVSISWIGGTGKVQIGIISADFAEDGNVLGWIALAERPNGSVLWNGDTLWDLTGSVSRSIKELSNGPYKIVAVSSGKDSQYCVEADKGCYYDVSDYYFAISPPSISKSLLVSCVPSVTETETGSSVTWFADATKGKEPYTYVWSGTDGIAALPTRDGKGKLLDVTYHFPGVKIAGVRVRDASGDEYSTSCKLSVAVSPTSSAVTVFAPLGGERFFMTRTSDLSQAGLVSWRLTNPIRFYQKKIKLAFIDRYGRSCVVGSTPYNVSEGYVTIIDGFNCGGWSLVPGEYWFRVYVEGSEAVASATVGLITLVPPVSEAQSITASAPSVKSKESVRFAFSAPSNAFKSALHLHCPSGVTATTPNVCNRYNDVSAHVASSSDYVVSFVNETSEVKTVSANFYAYLPNNPNFGRGVQTFVSVLSASPATSDAVTVLAPNGGESIKHGSAFVYSFSTKQTGAVDLSLVPEPSIDSSQVCTIVKGVGTGLATSSAQYSYTLPADGSCPLGPAKKVQGIYKLFAVLQSGNVTVGSDVSDNTFTVSASSTPAQ